MKKWLSGVTCLVVLAAINANVSAITVDGDISDWSASNIFTDPVDNAGGGEMVRWGAKFEAGYLYSFVEVADNPVEAYFAAPTSGSKARRIVPGLWVDADHSNLTALDSASTHQPWVGGHDGIDVNVEWGGGTVGWPDTGHYDFWGAGDTAANAGTSWLTNGAAAYAGQVMEFKVKWTDLVSDLASYPDAVAPKSYMKVALGIQSNSRGTGNGITNPTVWGYDLAAPVNIAILPGDANDDGIVNFSDYLLLSQNFNKTGQDWAHGDFNFDGTVNFADYLLLSQNFGKPRGSEEFAGASVPEPITLAIFGLGALLIRRKVA
jgi:hypothetical protein